MRVSRTLWGERKPSTSSRGNECWGPSESTTASSLAAACSSKSNVRQKRLRRASPRARFNLAPRGEWTTSCMPPVSSKNLSRTNRSVVGKMPSSASSCSEVGGDLLGDGAIDPGELFDQPHSRLDPSAGSRGFATKGALDNRTKLGDRSRKLGRASGCLAQPEGHRRRGPFGVDDAHGARLDLADAPGGTPEEEDVSCHRLDGPVLVDGPDEGLLRLEHDPEVGHVRDGSARGHRCQAGPSPRPQHRVHTVTVKMSPPPSPACHDAVGDQADDRLEVLLAQGAVRSGPSRQLEQLGL